ncbi:MAG: glycerol-3-phosphate 1-O-acyltransferase PlsB [Xanthomonadales bacterium]|nr:glycerol-3-phosphate 1-O-acyltransferase PlsB [Xanthomonadales bacterium]
MQQASRPTPLTSRLRLRWHLLLRGILHWWVKARAMPDADGNMGVNADGPVCYVMDEYALSSVLILDRVCEQHSLPRPLLPMEGLEGERRSYAVLRRLKGLLIRHPSTRRASDVLRRLVDLSYANPEFDIRIVPVTVFVGRAPDKTKGVAKILFAENWEVAGRTRRLFGTLINGRDTLVQFSRPISLRELADEDIGAGRSLRKVSRMLRTHFRRVRTAVIGPDLSHRRMLIDRIVKTPSIRAAIAEKARRERISEEEAARKARKYAYEIAADYSYNFIRIAALAIGWFTGRVLSGIHMNHFERLKEQALGHEIIYVPCHRSHMDYLLLSFLLHENGFVPPHVAAGINLNLPLIGSFLRGGGAFYLRRSFRSQKLYSAVFNEYVSAIIAQGVSIEYFVEGTRSRTGRLLPPKAGMLAMSVKAYLHAPVRPVMFVPVYLGYEQLMEGASYTRELSGTAKRSERLSDLLKVFKVLRNNYGAATVNFGKAIFLDDLLREHDPDWRRNTAGDELKSPWLSGVVSDLGQRIMTGINCTADVNPVTLLATALLATPKHALGERDLLEQLALYQSLIQHGPFGGDVTMTTKQAPEIISYGEALGLLDRVSHPLGDIIALNPDKAVELTYFRNNVAHLFAAPALIACCFLNQRQFGIAQLETIARAVYPYLKAELFLPWDEAGFIAATSDILDQLESLELVTVSSDREEMTRASGDTDKAGQLGLLALSLLQTLERYYITVAVLAKNGSGTLTRGQLEKLCILTAQRISRLHAFEAPEFYDRSLFRQFISELRNQGILSNDEEGALVFDQRLDELSEHARYILRKEIRLVITRLAPQAISEATQEE